jgi:hypothetical protein
MRPLAASAFAGVLGLLLAYATPAHAFFEPPSWYLGASTKILVRVLEWVDWAKEDLRAQVDRRNRWDPPPPVLAPALDAVGSGGSTTAPASLGMLP